jgi:hypothetical protein
MSNFFFNTCRKSVHSIHWHLSQSQTSMLIISFCVLSFSHPSMCGDYFYTLDPSTCPPHQQKSNFFNLVLEVFILPECCKPFESQLHNNTLNVWIRLHTGDVNLLSNILRDCNKCGKTFFCHRWYLFTKQVTNYKAVYLLGIDKSRYLS